MNQSPKIVSLFIFDCFHKENISNAPSFKNAPQTGNKKTGFGLNTLKSWFGFSSGALRSLFSIGVFACCLL